MTGVASGKKLSTMSRQVITSWMRGNNFVTSVYPDEGLRNGEKNSESDADKNKLCGNSRRVPSAPIERERAGRTRESLVNAACGVVWPVAVQWAMVGSWRHVATCGERRPMLRTVNFSVGDELECNQRPIRANDGKKKSTLHHLKMTKNTVQCVIHE